MPYIFNNMAGNINPPGLPPADDLCDYNIFSIKPEGKVACLALEEDAEAVVEGERVAGQLGVGPYGSITGIAFQQVDTGIVRPVMSQNEFSPVNWPNAPAVPNAPARNLQYLHLPPPHPIGARPIWEEFTIFMAELQGALLQQMTRPNRHAPVTLYKAMKANYWRGGLYDNFDYTDIFDRMEHIQAYMGNRGTWTQNETFREWAICVFDGLDNNNAAFEKVLKTLFPTSTEGMKQRWFNPPGESTKNISISRGVRRCLLYGYAMKQSPHSDDSGVPDFQIIQVLVMVILKGAGRGRLEKRVLLEKRLGKEQNHVHDLQ
ncbi:uncharacterized protein [Amphiura filiformis]|uniref:uncharacterized protein n=1 Tax=Amphiura filiformis TaxID=82378 RepID=UPI003B21FE65